MEHAPDVNDNLATRFLGIVLGVSLMITFVLLSNSMGWHQAVGGILTGLSGAVLGALGSSVYGRNTAAILGWAGGINFILGILMFFGMGKAFPIF